MRRRRRTSKALWQYLATRPEALPADPLFTADQTAKRPLNRGALHRLVKRLGQGAGVMPDAHPHRFRHTFATNYLRNGGDACTL